MSATDYIRLIRVRQWYKNLVVFLPLIFLGLLFDQSSFTKVFLGFIALCLISSSNYIINDIIDIKKDRLHPEKKNRPLAAGKISVTSAITLAVLLAIASLMLGFWLDKLFFAALIALFALTQVYSVWLKDEIVLDVVIIGVNFVIRAVAGTFILRAFISPWLVLCPFFLALILAIGKREADLRFLNSSQRQSKPVLKKYTLEMTNSLMLISTACLIISYSLYSFSRTGLLILTVPIALYTVFRYYYHVSTGSEIARHPERAYKDTRLVLAVIIWAALVLFAFYAGTSATMLLDHPLLK